MRQTTQNLLLVLLTALASGCTQHTPITSPEPAAQVRVSDQYRSANVESYVSFDCDIRRHSLVLMTLRSGTQLPMLCRLNGSSLSALPQSVFTSSRPNHWSMMVEPEIEIQGHRGPALMSLCIDLREGHLWLGGQKLARRDPQPALTAQ